LNAVTASAARPGRGTLADASVGLRVATVDQQRRHQLAEPIVGTAGGGQDGGQFLVDVRIVRIELGGARKPVDGGRQIAVDQREPGDGDEKNAAPGTRTASPPDTRAAPPRHDSGLVALSAGKVGERRFVGRLAIDALRPLEGRDRLAVLVC
jgi:hypothetical protein